MNGTTREGVRCLQCDVDESLQPVRGPIRRRHEIPHTGLQHAGRSDRHGRARVEKHPVVQFDLQVEVVSDLRFTDLQGLLAVLAGEHPISGLSSRRLQKLLPQRTRRRIGRLRRRRRLHGLIKKVGKTYKYYATNFGQRILLAGLKLKEHLLLPALASA